MERDNLGIMPTNTCIAKSSPSAACSWWNKVRRPILLVVAVIGILWLAIGLLLRFMEWRERFPSANAMHFFLKPGRAGKSAFH